MQKLACLYKQTTSLCFCCPPRTLRMNTIATTFRFTTEVRRGQDGTRTRKGNEKYIFFRFRFLFHTHNLFRLAKNKMCPGAKLVLLFLSHRNAWCMPLCILFYNVRPFATLSSDEKMVSTIRKPRMVEPNFEGLRKTNGGRS